MSDASAHLPFLPQGPETLTPNSFFAFNTEDELMEAVWRLRRWSFGTGPAPDDALVWKPSVGTEIELIPYDTTGPIFNGEDTVAPTAAFADEDDILTAWRMTRVNSGTVVGSNSFNALLFWGPLGSYSEIAPEDGGLLDSELLITLSAGDILHYLGTQQNKEVAPGIFLENTASAILHFNGVPIALYFETNPDEPTDDWRGELFLDKDNLYFAWDINGTPTYDVGTGEQLANPLRLDSNGSPRAYFCQQA